MYTSPDEARSDLFLAGGFFVIGPLVLGILLELAGITRIRAVQPVLTLVLPLVYTLLVPWLLMRYRRESLAMYGLTPSAGGLAVGALVAAPLTAAVLVAYVVGSGFAAPPLLRTGAGGGVIDAVEQFLRWIGLAGLAVYATVKARDAFRSDYRTVPDGVKEIGRIVGIVIAVASVLLLAPFGLTLDIFLIPLGAAGLVLLTLQQLGGPSSTSRAVLLTPTILLALDSRPGFGDAASFVALIWQGALLAAIGLAIAALLERKRSALPALGIAVVLGLTTAL